MIVLGTVLSNIDNDKSPKRLDNHAAIVKECMRLFLQDKLWQETIEANPELARNFVIEPLVDSDNPEYRSIGIAMGSAIITKVANIDIENLSEDDYVQDKVTQSMIKYLVDGQSKLRLKTTILEETLTDLGR